MNANARGTAKLPRFVELVRVSSEGQASRDTPEDQRTALNRLRLARPGTLVQRIDSTVSGAMATTARSDLQALFKLAAERAFDEVRVRHIDRLTRHDDARERFAVYGAIRDAGAVIVEAASGRVIDPADEMGELDLSLQGWFAAREKRRILERTLSAKRRKAAEGRLVQGSPPFARTYNKSTGQWGVDAERAKVYGQMFAWSLAGLSLSEIAAKLNSDGRLTTRGKEWTGANVCKLLREEAAVGRYRTQGRTFEIPAIVDEATFWAVDERLRQNNRLSGPKPKVFALLRKIAVCGVCDAPMYLQLGGGTPARFRYYYCSARQQCESREYHHVEDVDAAVTRTLRDWLDDPTTLAEAGSRRTLHAARDEARREITDAEAALRKLATREANTARLLTKGLIQHDTGITLLAEIKKERAETEARLSFARARLGSLERNVAAAQDLHEATATLRRGLGSATPERWRALVEVLFPRGGVRIYPNGKVELAGRVAVGKPLPNPSTAC